MEGCRPSALRLCEHAGSTVPFLPCPSPTSATHIETQLNTPSVRIWIWFPQKHPETRIGVHVVCGKEERGEGWACSVHCPAGPPVGTWGSGPLGTLGDGVEHASEASGVARKQPAACGVVQGDPGGTPRAPSLVCASVPRGVWKHEPWQA